MIFILFLIIYSILLVLVQVQMFKSEKIKRPTKKDLLYLLLLFAISISSFILCLYLKLAYKYTFSYIVLTSSICCFSMALHYKAIKDLGDNWCDSSKTKNNSYLVTSGLYKIVRHPIYLAFFLEGISLSLISPYLIGIGFCKCFIGFYRLAISREEYYLEKKYGLLYEKYKEKVKYKMIPFIY